MMGMARVIVDEGLHDEAVQVSTRALELAPDERKQDYEQYLARITQLAGTAGGEDPATP